MTSLATTKAAKLPRVSERDADLLEDWIAGASLRELAKRPGVNLSHEGVRKAINRALEVMHAESEDRIDKFQTVAMTRLDRLLRAIWSKATAGDLAAIREARQIILTHARVAGVLASDGTNDELDAILAERERMAEIHGEAVVQVLILVLGDQALGLSPEKQAEAQRLAGRHLRELASGE